MSEIKEYRLIEANLSYSLESRINELLKEGWQPFGNPIMVYRPEKVGGPMRSFIQAMVKYKQIVVGMPANDPD